MIQSLLHLPPLCAICLTGADGNSTGLSLIVIGSIFDMDDDFDGATKTCDWDAVPDAFTDDANDGVGSTNIADVDGIGRCTAGENVAV